MQGREPISAREYPQPAQALDCLGDGGVQLVREAGHEDECFHVAVCNPATVAAQDAPDECPVIVILDLPPRRVGVDPALTLDRPACSSAFDGSFATMEVICLLLSASAVTEVIGLGPPPDRCRGCGAGSGGQVAGCLMLWTDRGSARVGCARAEGTGQRIMRLAAA